MRGEKWRRCSRKIHTYFGVLLYHGTAVFVNCGKGQPPKAMGFWRRVVRPTGFEPAAYRVGVIKLSSRKPCGARAWLRLHKFPAIYEKTSEALLDRASEIFRCSSQIVVWIKCGFSSPVQLNIFTLYPWIRSAASHPSTLARSSTIPACAFASSYHFCS